MQSPNMGWRQVPNQSPSPGEKAAVSDPTAERRQGKHLRAGAAGTSFHQRPHRLSFPHRIRAALDEILHPLRARVRFPGNLMEPLSSAHSAHSAHTALHAPDSNWDWRLAATGYSACSHCVNPWSAPSRTNRARMAPHHQTVRERRDGNWGGVSIGTPIPRLPPCSIFMPRGPHLWPPSLAPPREVSMFDVFPFE